MFPCRNTSSTWRTAQPSSVFGVGSTRKRGRQLCMRCASASRCTAPIPCNWCLLISSWLRPPLVKYCLNSNTGKGKTSLGSGFWFPFSIYQGRSSSAFQHCAMFSPLPCLKGISERLEESHTPLSSVGLGKKESLIGHERAMKADERFAPSAHSHKRSSVNICPFPLWLPMALKSLKFPTVLGCALISGNQHTFCEAIA